MQYLGFTADKVLCVSQLMRHRNMENIRIAAFATPDLPELVAVETVGEARDLIMDLDLNQPPAVGIDLTQRVWKTKFSQAPMKYDIALADP